MVLKKVFLVGCVFSALLLFFVEALRGEAVKTNGAKVFNGQFSETEKMQKEFERLVGEGIALEPEYLKPATDQMLKMLATVSDNNESQFFVYIDRNPAKQRILVCFFNADNQSVTLIGADKASTGNQKRAGFFITPCGVYKNTIKYLSYRALGTKNDKGWRGLGAKGSRVWDFGWQRTQKNNQEWLIRLLMHATDPNFGEKRLGRVDSKGCIRISGKMNKFLDHFGLLDKEYEANKNKKIISWLLKSDREPSVYAGKYLVIGDSGN